MNDKTDSKPTGNVKPTSPVAPRKRFHLEKLEERIAPTPHTNPHTRMVGAGNGNSVFTSSTY